MVIPANWVPGTYLVEVSDAYFGGTGVGDGASPSRKPMYLHIVPSRSTRQARGRLTGRSALGAQTQQTTAKKPVKKGKKPAKGAGKMPTLSLKEFRLRNGAVTSLTRGPDGNLWFTDGNYIGRITPQGKITEFAAPPTPAPFQDQFDPTELMLGPDGNLWYVNTNGNKIGRVTPQGQFSTFTLPDHYYIPGPLIHGAHGSLWFPMQSGGYMGRITAQHTVQLLRWPSKQTQGPANEMVLGPNGKLWYMANQLFIGEILNS